jgi:mannitol-specific phosphotransferase system IIBC component
MEGRMMSLLESTKNHWFSVVLSISTACIAATWITANELLVKTRDTEINQLKSKIAELEKDLASKCTTVSPESENACQHYNRVVLHSKKGGSDQRGLQLIKLLNNKGCKVTGVVPVSQNIDNPEIRYFHKTDLDDARYLRDFIEQNINIDLTLNPVFELSYKAKEGYYEIWLN